MLKTGTTKSGFDFSIEENVMDNMEFMDAVAEVEAGNPIAISKLVDLMLGNEKKKLYNHLRNDDNRIPIEAVSNEITEIFTLMGANAKK